MLSDIAASAPPYRNAQNVICIQLILIQCSVLRLELPTREKNTQLPNFFKMPIRDLESIN